MDIPDFFTDRKLLKNYEYSFENYIDSDIDHTFHIENLSVPGDKAGLCSDYFKSILNGYNHVYISTLIKGNKYNEII